MKRELKFKRFKEADEFLRSLQRFFFEGNPKNLTSEEVIMLANDIYECIEESRSKNKIIKERENDKFSNSTNRN